MKLYEVLKVGAQTSAPTSVSEVDEDAQKLDELNMNVSEIKYLLNDIITNASTSNSSSVKKSTLTDTEVSEVLTMLEEFNNKYFQNIPLTERFTANFLWNIPRKVYDAAIKAQVRNKPVYFNPIFWFYIMCLDEPEDMIAPFVYEVIENLNKDDSALDEINKATNDYISTYLEDDNPIVKDESNGFECNDITGCVDAYFDDNINKENDNNDGSVSE